MGTNDAPTIAWNTSQPVAATAGVALAIGSTNSPIIADISVVRRGRSW